MSEETAGGSWKSRYETALQKMSEEAGAAEQLEARLRAAISRLAVLGLGGDRELDRRLEKLREAIHLESASDDVLKLVDGVSARVRLLAEEDISQQPVQGDDAYRRFLTNLLLLLRQTAPDDARVFSLLSRVRGAGQHDLPALSMAVENLVTQKLSSAERKSNENGLFGKLFGGGGDSPEDKGNQAMQLLLERLHQHRAREQQHAFDDLKRRLKHEGSRALIPVAAEVAELLERETRPQPSSPASNEPGKRAAEFPLPGGKPLSQVVLALRLPDEFADTADALVRQADEVFSDPKRLTGWLAELTGVIRHFRTQLEQERKGLHHFLEKTLSRLAELDGHFDAEDEERRRAAEKAHGLDQQLDSELSRLRHSLSDGQDMSQLQQQITRHVDSLGKGIRLRRQLDDDRERAMERRLREMRERVADLEKESDQLRDSLRTASRRSVLDPLTRLPNRRAWNERVAYEWARQQRRSRPLSLIICALDDISLINDRLGPEAGDVAIADFAEKLAASTQPGDFVARLEGVEFALLLPDVDSDDALEAARLLSERLTGGDFVYEDIPFSLSGVFGLAEFGEQDSPEAVVRRARQVLHEARLEGAVYRLAPLPVPEQEKHG
ncbi:diguanylate cyclase (GGDEF)-like protein [Natronospira proteinivora]|uniref:diguanylate cyclase n=1 Tax=Natronospira proteinivora TaxID=1807133 RepID=A0ABT1GFB1_9GAMM|nr:GGDEF domain-containing protein [Natronospira proteinivora]MCP1728617.1 diguanylate cyclase (GGDEF)-like protein [Natronospira proteinivora]